MAISEETIVKLVEDSDKLTKSDLITAKIKSRHLACSIVDVLLGQNLLSEDELGQILAQYFHVPYINLKTTNISPEVLNLVPEMLAVERGVIAFEMNDRRVSLAIEDPRDLALLELVKKTIGPGTQIKPYVTTKSSLKYLLKMYKQSTEDAGEAMTVTSLHADSAVLTIDKMLDDALRDDASDIHIEVTESQVLVRYRIDGVLHDDLYLSKNMHGPLVARIKVLSQLKLDEHRLPQDGNFSYRAKSGEKVSLRVSLIPMVNGEKVVLRILHDALTKFDLKDLGFSKKDQLIVEKMLERNHGIVLMTGPTGSGKTTTLYTMLGLLNNPGVNIITIEDPVENRIRRTNQIQVNTNVNLTFATGLRSILRQDPDIIMVGEIRDAETSVIAVNAAMTGHNVFSSVHANTAASAIPRMLDLGVEPFLLASTLNMVVAQRLVRILCSKCKQEIRLSDLIKKRIAESKRSLSPIVFKNLTKNFAAKGCRECNYTGFRGRTGVFEIVTVDEEIKNYIVEKKTSTEIWNAAKKKGATSMLEDGILKVKQGVTSIEELFRVISD